MAYNYLTGEWLCPCPNGSNSFFSRATGEVYCGNCVGGPAAARAWNPYYKEGYCICS